MVDVSGCVLLLVVEVVVEAVVGLLLCARRIRSLSFC